MNVSSDLLLYGGGAALVVGGSAAFGLALRPTGPLGRAVERYIARLDAECRFQCYSIDGRQMFARQFAGLLIAIAACLTFEGVFVWLLPLGVLIGPILMLHRLRKKRIERIEGQLDGWLLVLANMLKTTGGLGDALAASADLVRPPLRQELDRMLKEIRLGETLDDALRKMGERVKSSVLAGVLTLLVVGRRTGGEMPGLLETAAGALREMARLEGVIRSKTADGRMQVMVLGSAPVVVLLVFRIIDRSFFDPLLSSLLGYTLIGVAILLWICALLSARKILNVDF